MPRSYPMLLVAILAAGGWYFTKGPGAGKFPEFINSITHPQQTGYQTGNGNFFPQYPPNGSATNNPYPSPQTATPVPANYNGQPVRPPVPGPANGGPTIRIATYNIQVFGEKKAQNTNVMRTLASVIQQFQIVAIQEIRDKNDYFVDEFLRNYVNQNGHTYDKVLGPRLGRSNSKEQYCFLYDTSQIEVNPRCVFTVNDPDDLLQREPLVAMFRVRGPPAQQAFTFVLIDMHTEPDDTKNELNALGQVYQAVRRACPGEDDIILLGDLNVDDQHLGDLGRIDGIMPVVRHTFTNTRQNAQYDNIIFHAPSTTEFTGRWGVYNVQQIFGLSLDQALLVSDHFPVWAEFNAYESMTPGRVATRDANLRNE